MAIPLLGRAASALLAPRAMAGRVSRSNVTIQWFGDQVQRNITVGMRSRTRLAAQLLRDRVVVNISRPVTKIKSKSGRTRVDPASRSKPGEFPKADTTRLMKDIYWESRGDLVAIVGTTLDYGLWLETRMDRSFLRRTLREQQNMIRRILVTGPRLPGQTR
jgi:hypothetical protein